MFDTGTPVEKMQVTWLLLSMTPVPVTPDIVHSTESAVSSKLLPETVSVPESASVRLDMVGLEASSASY